MDSWRTNCRSNSISVRDFNNAPYRGLHRMGRIYFYPCLVRRAGRERQVPFSLVVCELSRDSIQLSSLLR